MDKTKMVRFEWTEKENKGNLILILKMSIINRYTILEYLDGYDSDIGMISFPTIGKNAKYTYITLKNEIEEFELILKNYGLLNKNESPFHSSHLLYIVQNFNKTQNQLKNQQNTNIRLSNRIELLNELNALTRESNYDYDITISKKTSAFKYTFSGESLLKKQVLRYLIGEVRSHLKTAYKELWNAHFENIETSDKEKLQMLTDHELTQKAIGNVSKNIVDYLNNETIALTNKKKVNETSLTNKQGEFIYEILTLFKVYSPQQRTTNEAAKVNHHDAIRKLVQRYADNIEDS